MKLKSRFLFFFFLLMNIQLFLPTWLKKKKNYTVASLNCFLFLSKVSWAYVYRSTYGLCFLFNSSLCLSFQKYHSLHYRSQIITLEVEQLLPLIFLFKKLFLTALVPLPFHINCRIILSIFTKIWEKFWQKMC